MGNAAMATADVRRRMKNTRAQLKRCREKESEAIGQALSEAGAVGRRRAVEHICVQTPVDELAELTKDDCLARYSCNKMVSSCRFIAELAAIAGP